jgi:hypothetical protein
MELLQWFADFPVVAEGIDEAADAPSIFLIGDGPNLSGSGFEGAREDSIGIVDDHDHASGRAADRFRAEIFVLGRFVSHPEVGVSYCELRDNIAALAIEAEKLASSEGLLVKVDSLGTAPD